jgi:uncharacterized protein
MKNMTNKNWKILAIITLVVIFASSVMFTRTLVNNARMETNLDEYMPKDHPAFVYSDQAEEWFNIKDGILIAIQNQDGIYNPATLQMIKDISNELIAMPEFDAIDVVSLYTADNIIGTEYDLDVTSFYTDVPESVDELRKLRQDVRDNEMIYRRVVSEDETVALIIAGMDSDVFTQEFYLDIMEFAHAYGEDSNVIYVAGRPIVEGTMALLGPEDMKRMVPVVLIVIALVLYVLLRSVRAAGFTLIGVFVSTIYAFGLMATLGVPIYSVTTMIPVMLIAIGVAYGIYFFNHLNQFTGKNPAASRIDGLKHTVGILWKPLSMAAFTTMIGFLSLLSSQVYPIKHFGVFTAFGILTAFVLALVFLPAAVLLFGHRIPKTKNAAKDQQSTALNRMTDWLLAGKKKVFIITAVILVLAVGGITRVWINSSFLDNFEKDSDIVLTDAFVNSKFGGTSSLNVILEGDHEDVFKMPETLELIDRMQTETMLLAEVGNSFSLADYLKRMNKVMNADDEAYFRIPESREMVA